MLLIILQCSVISQLLSDNSDDVGKSKSETKTKSVVTRTNEAIAGGHE